MNLDKQIINYTNYLGEEDRTSAETHRKQRIIEWDTVQYTFVY